jgi:ABC-type lipoprotein export system ATPase subunit
MALQLPGLAATITSPHAREARASLSGSEQMAGGRQLSGGQQQRLARAFDLHL